MKENVQMAIVSGSAQEVLFRVQGHHVHLHKDGTYLGTFLAPDAHIDLGEGATLTGALYGKKVHIKKRVSVTGQPALDLFMSLFVP